MSEYSNDVVLSVICPGCGEIDLTTDQVWLVIASAPERSLYLFRCSGCQQQVSHRADDAVLAVLTELAAVEELEIPEEEQHDGPPLTVDDLLDLMLKPLTDLRGIEMDLSGTPRSAAA
jgi:hypothetical protein